MSDSESESRETVADIVAEMRYGTIPKYRTDHELLALYADRIEAIDSADAWRSLYTPGNAAAMREALELCVKEMCNYCRNEAIARGLELTCVDGCEAYKIAQAALSAPARNCDVGTPEEQGERCLAQFEQWRRKGDGKKLITAIMTWAQMPYTAEEGGAK